MKPSVLCIGNVYMKSKYEVSKPKMYGDMYAEAFELTPSGFAAECAYTITALGGYGYACCKIAGDYYGAKLLKDFQGLGVSQRFIYTDKTAPTGSICKLGSDVTVIFEGANANFGADEIENAMISYPELAVVDMTVPLETSRASFEYAKKYQVKTIASFSSFDSKRLETANDLDHIIGCEIIMVDSKSAFGLTGVTPTSPDLCVKTCLEIINRYSGKYVILRLDERGSMSYDGIHCEFHPGIHSSEKFTELSQTAFIGAFALDYARNGNAGHACKAANIVSAYAEINSNSLIELPTAAQINKYVKELELKI